MKTYSEIRSAAWKELREGHWVAKYVLMLLVLMILVGLIRGAWNYAVVALEIQTWDAFLLAKSKALASGLDLTVPSRTIALRMTEATLFAEFINFILSGLMSFAVSSLMLRAAKGVRAGWFGSSFGGFMRPLGVAWLLFRQCVQIWLWSLLFVIPGFIAIYRYCQCWNLKVENPDWSAGKCLAESGRMMKGHKWSRFALDCSYWKPITALLFGLLVLTTLATGLVIPYSSPSLSSIASVVILVLSIVCCWGSFVLATYLSIGQALFYLELKATPPTEGADHGRD